MAARSVRRISKHRVETRECVTGARTEFALRADHNHNDRVRIGAQNWAALDRRHVHSAGLLANHAPRVFGASPSADCSC